MADVSLVIPFLNEKENLEDLLVQLNEYAGKQSFSIEAILVDDGSTDESVQIIKSIITDSISSKLICLSKNYGSHAALRAGISQSDSDYTMFFSADLQEPFTIIGDMYEKAREGYDIVAARKAEVHVSFFEMLFSNIYTTLIRRFAVRDYPRGGANNFLFNEKVKNLLNKNIESNSSIHMQLIDMGFRRAIIDVSMNQRNKGKTKWTLSKKIKLFIDSFLAFSYAPIRAISLLGITFFMAGFIYALWIILAKLSNSVTFDAGFPTIICVLLLGFGSSNYALCIVAEYLWRTLDAARARPVFIIDTIETLSTKNEN